METILDKPWYEELYEDFREYEKESYTQSTAREVDFIESVIDGDRSKRILDVGCGIGRHALELARRGYSVVGVDLSASMLEKARTAASAENLPVEFLQRDARRLNLSGGFDAAIMLCEGAFSLMEEDHMDQTILENIFRALSPRGMLILTGPNAAYKLAQEKYEGFDPVTFRERFKLEKDLADGRRKMLDCSQRYYTCPELNKMLTQAGFANTEFFACAKGGYRRGQAPNRNHFELGAIAVKLVN